MKKPLYTRWWFIVGCFGLLSLVVGFLKWLLGYRAWFALLHLIPLALWLYVLLVKPREEQQIKEARRRGQVEGFVRGFLTCSAVPGSVCSAVFVAQQELDRVSRLKAAPESGSDPFYAARTEAMFGLLSIEKYALRDGIDALYEYCQRFHTEADRPW